MFRTGKKDFKHLWVSKGDKHQVSKELQPHCSHAATNKLPYRRPWSLLQSSRAGVKALLNHPRHRLRHEDVPPEPFLLQELEGAQRRAGIAVDSVSIRRPNR